MKYTRKEEAFCQLMAAGVNPETNKTITQSDAYRLAYAPPKCSKKKINEKASELMAKGKIKGRIAELMAPAIAKVQLTREEWLDIGINMLRADVRKMFVGPGQPIEIAELGDNEAAIVEGYEVTENFAKVGDKAEHVGYTHKVKLTGKLKRWVEIGKAMQWYVEKVKVDETVEFVSPDFGKVEKPDGDE